MVTAELTYNPYLCETKILFNGHAPRINSLVEKYQGKMLQSWIGRIPEIFHDEMNGYNFKLEFSGTNRDYSELKNVFAKAGVSEQEVRISRQNRMEEREEKLKKLEDLLVWLKENENDHFDLESFFEINSKIFDEPYSFVIVRGRGFDTSKLEAMDISVEEVDDVQKLDDTVLDYTPLLICVDQESLPDLQEIIHYFKNRKNKVEPEQVFFYIHPALDVENVTRIIRDLKVREPQIVKRVDDEAILRYLEIYPFTEYIIKASSLLREQIDSIGAALKTEEEKNTKSNVLVHENLNETGTTISRLKVTRDSLQKRGELEIPVQWIEFKNVLYNRIRDWKKNKTRITREDEAARQAYEFDKEVHKQLDLFTQNLNKDLQVTKEERSKLLVELYECAKTDIDFSPVLPQIPEIVGEILPSLFSEFMELKEETVKNSVEDFMGFFIKGGIPQSFLEISYYYKSWREHAIEAVEPIVDRLIERCLAALHEYDTEATDIYIDHIQELIEYYTEEQKNIFDNMSAEEQKVQDDKEWLQELSDRVKDIQNG